MVVGLVDEGVVVAVDWTVSWQFGLCWFGWRWIECGVNIEQGSELKKLKDVEQLGFSVEWFCVRFRVWRFGDNAQNFFLQSMEGLQVSCVGLGRSVHGDTIQKMGVNQREVKLA